MTADRPRRLYVHVEEPSMEVVIETLLPSLLRAAALSWKVIDHGSKYGLQKNLPHRLAGYAKRLQNEDIRVLVLLDQDDDDCRALKEKLEDVARQARLATKSAPDENGRFRVVNRIVVKELEAWFFGDIPALRAAYDRIPETIGQKVAFRDPDAIKGGTWEALFRVLRNAGHYVGADRLPKIEVARKIAPHLRPERNRSASFRHFTEGLAALTAG